MRELRGVVYVMKGQRLGERCIRMYIRRKIYYHIQLVKNKVI